LASTGATHCAALLRFLTHIHRPDRPAGAAPAPRLSLTLRLPRYAAPALRLCLAEARCRAEARGVAARAAPLRIAAFARRLTLAVAALLLALRTSAPRPDASPLHQIAHLIGA
jgi:hypothetical protein